MTGEPGAKGVPLTCPLTGVLKDKTCLVSGWERDELLAWVGEHLTLVRLDGFRAAARVLDPGPAPGGGPGR